MTSQPPDQGRPYGFLFVLAIVAILYAAALANGLTIVAGGGEAVVGAAYEAFFLVAGLWLALALLIVVAAVMGDMPGAAAWAIVPLLPISGVAALTAIDMCSRHMRWAIVFPALLAGLISFYACWARLPGLRGRMPTKTAGFAVWGAAAALSAAAFAAAAVW